MKLYVYDHCPYCVKARMIFGLKNVPVELITLLNDDEATPKAMIGKKMVPILELDTGDYMPESMDIIHYIDGLEGEPVLQGETNEAVAEWLGASRDYLYKLAMPRWVKADLEEFKTQGAIDYFTQKKEAMIGSFEEHLAHSEALIRQAEAHLQELDGLIQKDASVNEALSEDDIHLYAVLRSLRIVKGLKFPNQVRSYFKVMTEATGIPDHKPLAV